MNGSRGGEPVTGPGVATDDALDFTEVGKNWAPVQKREEAPESGGYETEGKRERRKQSLFQYGGGNSTSVVQSRGYTVKRGQ